MKNLGVWYLSVGLEVSRSYTIVSWFILSHACKSEVRSQLLVWHHVCISTSKFAIVMIIDSNPRELCIPKLNAFFLSVIGHDALHGSRKVSQTPLKCLFGAM